MRLRVFLVISFEIPGKPVPQERRVQVRGGWSFDPAKSRKAKRLVKLCALAARPAGSSPTDRSFIVEIVFYGPHWGSDLDNLAKLVLDGMKGVFWVDDHQVCELILRKIRVPKGNEKTVVRVTELRPQTIEEMKKGKS